jgi:hypothetical protein
MRVKVRIIPFHVHHDSQYANENMIYANFLSLATSKRVIFYLGCPKIVMALTKKYDHIFHAGKHVNKCLFLMGIVLVQTDIYTPIQWNNNVVKELYLQTRYVGLVTVH